MVKPLASVYCLSSCSEGVPVVVLVMFSYQGDNIKEALQLATFLDSWLMLRDSSVSINYFIIVLFYPNIQKCMFLAQ